MTYLLRRAAVGISVVMLAVGLPVSKVAASVTAPTLTRASAAAATVAPNLGGPFSLHFGDDVSDGMIGGTATPGAGNLEVRGDEDVYTLAVPAGGARAVLTVPNGGGLNWSLLDSSGRDHLTSSNFVSQGPIYLAADTYRLTVTPIANSAYAGPYAFSIDAVPAPQSFNIALDQTVDVDQPVSGEGRLETPGSVDLYHFNVPAGGAPIYFQSLTGCFCRLSLREDATGRSIYEGGDSNFGPLFLPAGNFTLLFRGNTDQTTAIYRFKLWRNPDVQTFNFPSFPGTPISVAANGADGSGKIEMNESADVYTFTLAAGSVPTNVRIALTGNCGHRFTLIAPSGVTLVDRSCSSPVIVTASEAGQYRLVVSDYANQYSLSVQTTTSAPTVTVSNTKFNITLKSPSDPTPNNRALNIPADVTTPAGAGNLEVAGAQDAYAFNGTAGNDIYVETPSPFAWQLRSPSGRSLFGATGIGSDQKIRLPESGQYVLTVFGTNSSPTGAYSFKIWSVPPPERFNITLAAPNASRSIYTDAVGAGSGNLESVGAQDVYVFNSTVPGQRLYFGDATSGPYTYWRLIGPDGREFIGSDYYIGLYNGMGETGVVDLREAGQYELLIYGANTYHGAYSFAIWTADPPRVTPINIGNTVAASLPGPGAEDVYTFHASAGDQLYIQGLGTLNNNIRWRLYDPAGINRSLAYYGYHRDGWWFISEAGDFNGGSDVLEIHRSGTYKLVVSTGNRTGGGYAFDIWSAQSGPPQLISLGQLVNGDLAIPGVINHYRLNGARGRQVKVTMSGSHPSWVWCVYTLDGFLPCTPQAWTSTPTISVPPGVDPSVKVWDSGSNKVTGSYSFSTADVGASTNFDPFGDYFPISIGDTVGLDAPASGAGSLEVPGTSDTYQFDAVSGDAVYFDGTGHCASTATNWTLRDPEGNVVFDMPLTGLGCQVGPVVLPRTGTYLLTVGGATEPSEFGFTLRRVTSLQEPPTDDTTAGTPRITRLSPASGAAGGTSTIAVYGAHLPRAVAVHVAQAGVELPVTLLNGGAVGSSLEGRGAMASVNLQNVTAAGDYSVTVDFADGTTLAAPDPFHVSVGVVPHVDISFQANTLRPAAVNYAFIQIRNPTDADYYNGIFDVSVPCDGTSTIGGVTYPTSVRLIQHAPADLGPTIADAAQAQGASSALVDLLRTYPFDGPVAPRRTSGGTCYFLPYVNKVPAHGAVSLRLEIVPLTPPGVHQTGRLGSRITTRVFNGGSHLRPDASDSSVNALLSYYRSIPSTFFGGASRTAFVRASAVCDMAKGLAAAWSALGLELHTIGLFAPPAHEIALPFDIGAGIGALVDFFGCPEPPEPPADTPPQPCTPPNPPEDPGDPIPALRRSAESGGDPGCDPPVAPAHDPNDIVGPSEIGMGGTMTYTIDFENDGGGSAAKVDVLTHLDPERFDLSTFTLDEVGVGDASAVPTGNAGLATVENWAVNGTTVNVRSSLQDNGDLSIDFAGAPTEFEPAYGSFLPANTDATKPAGQGYVRFSVQLKDTVALGTVFDQQADIVFDQHAFGGTTTPTNVMETTVVPNRHPIVGQVLTLNDSPGIPTAKKLSFKTKDAGLSTMRDPRISGVNIYVRSNFGTGSSVDKYVLPASGWLVRGTKYMYKDSKLLNGPIKGAKLDLRTGALKIDGKGVQLTHSLAVMPDSVDIVLLAGGDEYCASFGGIQHNTPLKKFLGAVAPAPSSCPTLVFSG